MKRLPAVLLGAGLLGVVLLALPALGLVVQAPWAGLGDVVRTPGVGTAVRLSLVVSLSAVVVAFVLGLPVAVLLARAPVRGRGVMRALVLLPVVMPPVVAGVALVSAFSGEGFAGDGLRAIGLTLTGTVPGAVAAASFVSVPLFILAAEGGLRGVDERLEVAASTLGASRWTVLRRVTLPAVRGSLIAGAALTWARALGEFGATITFAGSVQGRTRTLPLAIYAILDADRSAAIGLSVVLLIVAAAVLVALGDRVRA